MKKIVFLSAVATLLLSAVSAFVYVNNDKDALDDLFDANVEALVRGESSGRAICYSQYTISEDMRCLICVKCDYVNGTGVHRGGYCKW